MLKIDGSLLSCAELPTVNGGVAVPGQSHGMGVGLAPKEISCAALATKDFTFSSTAVEAEARDTKSWPLQSEWTYNRMFAFTWGSDPSTTKRDSAIWKEVALRTVIQSKKMVLGLADLNG